MRERALSRSKKNILHVDLNEYYGGAEAALSLQEAEGWAEKHAADDDRAIFASALVEKEINGLLYPRAYSLALAPQIIHARSKLLDQLVSSKAFRQVEFLAVGSFYIYQPPQALSTVPTLSRIPSTREDVFSNSAIPTRAKRWLMKFLNFVLEYDTEAQLGVWKHRANDLLADFIADEFKLDKELQSYIITLTLSPDGQITVEDGLRAITKHLSSMGRFGTGFAAVYPKWGGLSEIAQVGCRAGAVGGATYILGSGVTDIEKPDTPEGRLRVTLTDNTQVKSKTLVQGSDMSGLSPQQSRLTAVVASGLLPVFEGVVEGAPTPAVAIVAFPSGSLASEDGTPSRYPIYAMVHSSEAGECPSGQSKSQYPICSLLPFA